MAGMDAGQSPPVHDMEILITSDKNFPHLYHPIPKNKPTEFLNVPKILPNVPTNFPNVVACSQRDHQDVDDNSAGKKNFADVMKPKVMRINDKGVQEESIPIKDLSFINGIPRVTWSEDEVQKMTIMENLQYTVIGKFFHGWPELEDIRVKIPKQCKIK